MNLLICLLFVDNLTNGIIELFGWGTMQSLWPLLNYLWDALEWFTGMDLSPLWERLFA